ncbi:MAG TPA: hypothetical protein VLF18_08555 [Tahibacter sp.]|uniref:hypothetical protein n=1 Tax=Tahibacter sp. TaxID=2056211 RepID=UPI002CD806A2|nr:hypothetical protein [Tahibacter sp.]HSX60234.1 hypothetical protein [Tahibacter sp.]
MTTDLRSEILRTLKTLREAGPLSPTASELADVVRPTSKEPFDHELRRLVAANVVERIHSPDGHRYQLRGKLSAASTSAPASTQSATAETCDDADRSTSYSDRRFMQEGTNTSRVYDALRSMTAPAQNADLCLRAERTTKEVNSALCTLRNRGLAVRYGENQASLWLDVDAPRAVLEMVPANLRGAPHGTPDAVRKHRRLLGTLEVVPTDPGAREVEIPRTSTPPPATVSRAVTALKPLLAAYQLHSHIASAVLDVEELLGDAIDDRATHAVLGHIQRAACELRFALALAKGA